MTRILLLTGFLGAGKTTLLQSLLSAYEEEKIGVIVNEFGEVNVDAKLVAREGIQMAELSNGSIFCACIKDKFVDSLIELSAKGLDYLFIEASGLADPANMSEILKGIAHKTNGVYQLEGSICVVDGAHFADMVELLPALANQVAYANAIIINKVDLASPEAVEAAEAAIREINPAVRLWLTSWCKVDLKEVVSSFIDHQRHSSESSNTYESRPSTFVVRTEEVLPFAGLQEFLKELAGDAFRIKGFAQTDQGNVQISAVVEDLILSRWEGELTATEIVIISSVGIRMLSKITKASKAHVGGGLKI